MGPPPRESYRRDRSAIGSAVSLTLTDLRDRTACFDVRERCILVVGSHQHDREPTKCRHGVRHRQVAVNCPGRLIALTLAVHRWPGSGTSRRPPRRFSGAESTEGADDPAVSDALPRRCCAFFSDCSHGSDVSGGRLQLVSAGTERRVRGPLCTSHVSTWSTHSLRSAVRQLRGVKARPRSTATSSVVGVNGRVQR